MGKRMGFFVVLALLGGVLLANAAEETLTITTYYPSPYGVYKN